MVLLAVPVLGMVLSRFIIGDGVDRYGGIEKKIAHDQLLYTQAFFAGEPYSQLTITAQRVISVRTCPQHGEVQVYTIFGIPHGELRFQCTGSDNIRCPAAGAECKQDHGSPFNTSRRRMAELDERREASDQLGRTANLSQYVET
ncbi:MAG TPA: hypothetical protein VFI90_13385 [Rubrobacter sp.]|nr:hypothetical protein [Rubrobacter sp.]